MLLFGELNSANSKTACQRSRIRASFLCRTPFLEQHAYRSGGADILGREEARRFGCCICPNDQVQRSNQKRIQDFDCSPQYRCSEPTLLPSTLLQAHSSHSSKLALRPFLNPLQEAHFFSQSALLFQVPIHNSATQIHLSRSPMASRLSTSYSNSRAPNLTPAH